VRYRAIIGLALGTVVATLWGGAPLVAQTAVDPLAAAIFDPGRKPERPEASTLRPIRFLTDDDYPPFHFIGPDGQLTGFNVELARAICAELRVSCTIQPRRWETLLPSLEEGRGDAVIASLMRSQNLRTRAELSVPYYRTPARFVTRKDAKLGEPTAQVLTGKRVSVARGTAHAAFLTASFPGIIAVPTADQAEAQRLLAGGEVDAAFGDSIQFAVWLNGNGAACCAMLGGPFFEARYFGEGASIAFKRDAAPLRRAVDFALYRVVETGVYNQLMLKYFPISFY
jgi:polar amino acid transport system substrate-binding protein